MEPPAVQKNKTECKMAIRNEEPHVNKCFPRVCGDVPAISPAYNFLARFSPRVRGCSGQQQDEHRRRRVFPACAGMFLIPRMQCMQLKSFPRVCGDVPQKNVFRYHELAFSPRVRGCSD